MYVDVIVLQINANLENKDVCNCRFFVQWMSNKDISKIETGGLVNWKSAQLIMIENRTYLISTNAYDPWLNEFWWSFPVELSYSTLQTWLLVWLEYQVSDSPTVRNALVIVKHKSTMTCIDCNQKWSTHCRVKSRQTIPLIPPSTPRHLSNMTSMLLPVKHLDKTFGNWLARRSQHTAWVLCISRKIYFNSKGVWKHVRERPWLEWRDTVPNQTGNKACSPDVFHPSLITANVTKIQGPKNWPNASPRRC